MERGSSCSPSPKTAGVLCTCGHRAGVQAGDSMGTAERRLALMRDRGCIDEVYGCSPERQGLKSISAVLWCLLFGLLDASFRWVPTAACSLQYSYMFAFGLDKEDRVFTQVCVYSWELQELKNSSLMGREFLSHFGL